jgi:hypothetical protein
VGAGSIPAGGFLVFHKEFPVHVDDTVRMMMAEGHLEAVWYNINQCWYAEERSSKFNEYCMARMIAAGQFAHAVHLMFLPLEMRDKIVMQLQPARRRQLDYLESFGQCVKGSQWSKLNSEERREKARWIWSLVKKEMVW